MLLALLLCQGGHQLLTCLLILLFVGGLAVPAGLVLHEGDALALDGLGQDHGGGTLVILGQLEGIL